MAGTEDIDDRTTLEKRELCRSIAESFVSVSPRSRFTFEDVLDRSLFYEKLETEVNSIYDSPRARKGRNIVSIRDSSFRGKVAEAWYVENQPFPGTVSWTDRRWHDILVNESKYASFRGTHIEIKTVSNWSNKEIFDKIDRLIWAQWNESSFVSMFLTNWDLERDKWFRQEKNKGSAGTFVQYVESGKSEVWWEYYGTRCIDPNKKIIKDHRKHGLVERSDI